jgi:hypothetical protein
VRKRGKVIVINPEKDKTMVQVSSLFHYDYWCLVMNNSLTNTVYPLLNYYTYIIFKYGICFRSFWISRRKWTRLLRSASATTTNLSHRWR